MTNNICRDHSGCVSDIEHLKEGYLNNKEGIDKMSNRIDKIFNRINLILGGIVVSCVMLVVGLLK